MIYNDAYDPDLETPVDLAEILKSADIPEWRKEVLLEAFRIEEDLGHRYIEIPRADSHEAYRDMQRFIVTVEDERLQNRLWGAIQGRGAFRCFKDTLYGDYREQKRWYAFRDACLRERALDWLATLDIEFTLVEPPPPPELDADEKPRARLLAEVLEFTRAASKLPGVQRIALIGSLTIEEPDPKDADMLVTVADDTDLEPLATLGRKL